MGGDMIFMAVKALLIAIYAYFKKRKSKSEGEED